MEPIVKNIFFHTPITYWIKFFCDILEENINWEKVKKYEMIICHNLGVITVKPLGGLLEPPPVGIRVKAWYK